MRNERKPVCVQKCNVHGLFDANVTCDISDINLYNHRCVNRNEKIEYNDKKQK